MSSSNILMSPHNLMDPFRPVDVFARNNKTSTTNNKEEKKKEEKKEEKKTNTNTPKNNSSGGGGGSKPATKNPNGNKPAAKTSGGNGSGRTTQPNGLQAGEHEMDETGRIRGTADSKANVYYGTRYSDGSYVSDTTGVSVDIVNENGNKPKCSENNELVARALAGNGDLKMEYKSNKGNTVTKEVTGMKDLGNGKYAVTVQTRNSNGKVHSRTLTGSLNDILSAEDDTESGGSSTSTGDSIISTGDNSYYPYYPYYPYDDDYPYDYSPKSYYQAYAPRMIETTYMYTAYNYAVGYQYSNYTYSYHYTGEDPLHRV